MKLPKDKVTLFFLIVFALLAVWLVLFIFMKLININSDKCEEDSHCTTMNSFDCFPSCGQRIAINKKYETSKNVETLIKCLPTLPLRILFFSGVTVDCIPLSYIPTKVVCNEKSRCEIVADCDSACSTINLYSERYIYDSYKLYQQVSDLKINNCECGVDLCSKIFDFCKDLSLDQSQDRQYCLKMVEELECEHDLYDDSNLYFQEGELVNFSLDWLHGVCGDVSPYNYSASGVKKINWIDDKTIKIVACVSINNAEEIINGSHFFLDDVLILEYESPLCGKSFDCVRSRRTEEVVYTISNLKKKNYQIELKRLI